jgi:hypothetical protein
LHDPKLESLAYDQKLEKIKGRITSDLGPTPVFSKPFFGLEGEHGISHSVIRPVPLGYNIRFQWRVAPLATGWLLLAAILAVLAFMIQWLETSASSNYYPGFLPEIGSEVFGWILKKASLAGLDNSIAGVILQNRAGLIVGLVALAVGALVRSGEHALLRRLLLFPRMCIVIVTFGLLVSALPLLMNVAILQSAYWILAYVLLIMSALSGFFLAMSWFMAAGFGRLLRARRIYKRGLGAEKEWAAWE